MERNASAAAVTRGMPSENRSIVPGSGGMPSEGRAIPLSLILLAAVAVHLPLLLMELPLKTYDTNFHIFFASHYLHHWFDPWNAKWYAGFSQTT